jgi:hypothetical protein
MDALPCVVTLLNTHVRGPPVPFPDLLGFGVEFLANIGLSRATHVSTLVFTFARPLGLPCPPSPHACHPMTGVNLLACSQGRLAAAIPVALVVWDVLPVNKPLLHAAVMDFFAEMADPTAGVVRKHRVGLGWGRVETGSRRRLCPGGVREGNGLPNLSTLRRSAKVILARTLPHVCEGVCR